MPSAAPNTTSNSDDPGRWPDRVIALCLAWRAAETHEQRNRILSELWLLVNAALSRYIRIHSQSCGSVNYEDARDIASEKAMAFLRSLEKDVRGQDALRAPQVCSYLSVLARNGLVDALRKRSRGGAQEMEKDSRAPLAPVSDGAELNVQRHQFVGAICDCLHDLTPKARTIWFFRAFLDMPSKQIAAHPDVGMTPTAVYMMLSRARRTLRECMEKKGFNSDDAPPGTFVALWELLSNRDVRFKEGESDVPAPDR